MIACGGPPLPATPEPSGPSTAPPPSANASASAEPSPPPCSFAGKAVVLGAGDPAAPRADRAGALKPPGEGGLTAPALVVRLTADVPVWRLWSGAAKKDADGRTNRMGQWWSYDAPHGNQQGYRTAYEICLSWNDLTWVAQCTLKKGAVVAIGAGNSVSPQTCADPTGKESYPVNPRDWQVWISKIWTRGAELGVPGRGGRLRGRHRRHRAAQEGRRPRPAVSVAASRPFTASPAAPRSPARRRG